MNQQFVNGLRIFTLLFVIAIVPAGLVRAADTVAPPISPITRLEIEKSDVPGTDLETRLYLITFQPGVSAPVHHHPVDGLGYIIEGKALSAFGNSAPVTLVAGQSFHDLSVTPHTTFSNLNSDKPLKFLVAYTVKKGIPVTEIP